MPGTAAELSLVIPAFNESERLPPFLGCVHRYLAHTYPRSHEVLVVDDGSRDDLGRVLGSLRAEWPELSYLRHEANRGKGAAVRTGVLAGRGRLILFSDADGATPIEEEGKLRREIEKGADVAVGSRLIAGGGVTRGRVWYRGCAGRCFARLAGAVAGLPVKDTQCGFKMFRSETGKRLFSACRETGYLFDVEVLLRAQRLGYKIAEVPVSWHDVPGSKVRLARDGWQMACGLLRLRGSLGREKAQSLPFGMPTAQPAP